jgi:thioredoxin-like negative regulator of GroEL
MDRIATFESFIARSPDDPFPRYGLAMELRNRGDVDAAIREFMTLMERFPDYVPTYLMAGTTLAAAGRADDAKDAFRRGLAAAGRKGDRHAAGELEAALAALP